MRTNRSAELRFLGRGERVELAVREHPISLVADACEAAFAIVPVVCVAWGVRVVPIFRGQPGDIVDLIALTIVGLALLRYAVKVIGWDRARVVVTNHKVICIRGVLTRNVAATPLSKVSEYTVHQTLLGRIFDYGKLVVDVPGGRVQALHGCNHLPDPAGIYRLISDLARMGERERRGGSSSTSGADADASLATAEPSTSTPRAPTFLRPEADEPQVDDSTTVIRIVD